MVSSPCRTLVLYPATATALKRIWRDFPEYDGDSFGCAYFATTDKRLQIYSLQPVGPLWCESRPGDMKISQGFDQVERLEGSLASFVRACRESFSIRVRILLSLRYCLAAARKRGAASEESRTVTVFPPAL